MQLSAPGLASIKMPTVHENLWKLSWKSDHSTPISAVKAYTKFYTLNTEMAIKTKEMDEVTSQHMTSHSNEKRRTKKELTSVLTPALSSHLETVIWGLLKKTAQYEASKLRASSMKVLETDKDSLTEISAQGPTRNCKK